MTPVQVMYNLDLMWARMLVVRSHDTSPVQVQPRTDVGQDVGGESTQDTGPGQVQHIHMDQHGPGAA